MASLKWSVIREMGGVIVYPITLVSVLLRKYSKKQPDIKCNHLPSWDSEEIPKVRLQPLIRW